MSESRIQADRVSLDIAGNSIVNDVSFEAGPGEFVALIGPNGAGKSTLLRIVGGQAKASEGMVRLMGDDVASLSPGDLAIRRAMLGANPPSDIPFPARTVVEAGRYPFRSSETTSPEEDRGLVDAAIETAELTELVDRSYRTLSSGEQARVMLARVLAQASPIALLDEPTASLDAANGEKALKTLTVERDDTTVVCVLHDLNQASFYADRLLLMSAGRLVMNGSPSEVLRSDLLSEVYGHRIEVVEHPFRPCPLVVLA